MIPKQRAEGKALLSFQDVSLYYRDASPLFSGLTSDLHPGAFRQVQGPSGSGKSTILRSLNPKTVDRPMTEQALQKRKKPYKIYLFLLLSLWFLPACDTVGYYTQALGGHLSIMTNREPLEKVVRDKDTTPELRRRIEDVMSIRHFAQNNLKLNVGGSYSKYVRIDRPYVAWSVFAAPKFSLDLKKWCFPIVGCMGYIGYFSKEDAQKKAARLREAGDDVHVSGVIAYSTLGWFDDPVLSSFIDRSRAKLGFLLFHELGHNTVYLKGDSDFNESFANTVALEGTRRWLTSLNDGQSLVEFETATARQMDFVQLIKEYRRKLKALYAQPLEDREMRKAKDRIYADMVASYHRMKERWGGYSGYDRFFEEDLNNAKIGSVSTYFDLVQAFRILLDREGGDLEAFYNRCRELGDLSKADRLAYLKSLQPGMSATRSD